MIQERKSNVVADQLLGYITLKRLFFAVSIFLLQGCNDTSTTVQESVAKTWYKGNTHAHTIISGHADSTPAEVAKWYYENGYDFLILSEHNHFIEPTTVQLSNNSEGRFILIPGQEITGKKDIHTTAMNISRVIPDSFDSPIKSEIIQKHLDDTAVYGGLAILNHPNWRSGLTPDDMKTVSGLHFFELFNGHPNVNNFGNFLHPSTEQLWDDLLSSGMAVYGLSADDAHQFKTINPLYSNPGKGWIMVRAESLTPDSVTESIKRGKFYSSNGVALSQCAVIDGAYQVEVDEEQTNQELSSPTLQGKLVSGGATGYQIEFIGQSGVILQTSNTTKLNFVVNDDHSYIRAKVTFRRTNFLGRSEEFYAWCQPVFTDGREHSIN